MSRLPLLVTSCLLLVTSTRAADPVWIEAETPTRTTAKPNTAGWGDRHFLSGGAWLTLVAEPADVEKAVPADGATFEYEFTTTADAKYDLWLRLGFESARTPFRVRIDDGNWLDVKPADLTTDLMAIADFAEVAWRPIDAVTLAAGKHTLRVVVPRPAKDAKAGSPRVLFGLDCMLLSPTPFLPNGPTKPNAVWQTVADRNATTVTFDFPAADPEPAARRLVKLAGTWQVARYDEPGEVVDRTGPVELPPDLERLYWKAIRVPGDKSAERPDLTYCHRFLYRTRVKVPASAAGRSVVLRFPSAALFATVYVNGKRVGHSDTPCAAFECDATAAVKPGEVNEIVVVVKDVYYAVAKTADGKSCRALFHLPPERFFTSGGLGVTRFADYPVLFKVRRSGLLEPPTIELRGPVYTADVFCISSVAGKKLDLDVTVMNPTDKDADVSVAAAVRVWQGDGKPVLAVEPKAVTVPAGKSAVVRLTQPWPDAKLWWPDDPVQHVAMVTLTTGGQPVDRSDTKFGFREWGIKGNQFTLNGIPWHFRADLRHNDREAGKSPDAAVKEWRRNGQNMVRFWGEEPWTGGTQEDTLDFFDQAGIAVRRSGIFDGEVASYLLVQDGQVNQPLFDNWRKQLAAWVKAERNHPSVFLWSLENEVTYINARNFGWLKQVEPEIRMAAELVRQLDPTRPAMIDGGDALMDRSLPVYGNHYLEQAKRDYPDEAYTLSRACGREQEKRPHDPWPIRPDKPLFLGESFFANGSPPAAYAEITGEAAFLGRRDAAAGVARFARMLSEGYRWHGVAAFHFWFAEGPDAEHYTAWQPVAVLCREWDTAFEGGAKLKRTLKVLNDTRLDSPLTVHWVLRTRDGKTQVRGKKDVAMPPGGAEEFGIELDVPKFDGPAPVPVDFTLLAIRNGTEVFRDTRPVRVLPTVAKTTSGSIAVYDPAGKAAKLLAGLADVTPVNDWRRLPAGTRVLVVGPDAVSAADAADPGWAALVANGYRVLVLDQAHPLRYVAVPAEVEPTTHTGRIAFPEQLSHPAFTHLCRDDFFCRSNGHVVYRNAYRKPGRGGRSLLQCDQELSCSALVEVQQGNGLMLLSQVAVGDRPTDIVCRHLVANLIRYATSYQPKARPTATFLPPDDPRMKLLADTGVKATPAADIRQALAAEVVIADGTPELFNQLAIVPDEVRQFFDRGGHLVVWGVTPESLGGFARMVDYPHMLRPFKMERVTLAATRPAVAAGLTLRDVALESAEKIYPWAGDRYPASDTFTHVVDLDDVAPFVTGDKFAAGWNQMTNGLTSADSWKFIFYHDQKQAGERPSWAGTLPRKETLTGGSVVINAHYRKLTKLRVVFDGNERSAEILTLKPEGELRQEFKFAQPRECRRIALEPVEWTDGSKPVIGIDNLWLTAKRPADFADRVQPITNIGGLVYYPAGKGGVLLNQLRVPAAEANPVNADKKRAVVTTLLRNLGCEFAGGGAVVPGLNLTAMPIPLGDKCNLYLTKDRGWIDGQPDLAHLPVGEQKFGGVRYSIRDFKTSPLPSAVALAGPGVKVKEKAVEAIPVGQAADALFLLHAFHPTREPNRDESPAVFEYVVKYAGGQTAVIPVRLGREVGPWNVAGEPASPSNAAVAWSAAFPNGPKDRSAAVYAMKWTNPRPAEAIESLSVRYNEQTGGRYGVPVVFAVTAASAK